MWTEGIGARFRASLCLSGEWSIRTDQTLDWLVPCLRRICTGGDIRLARGTANPGGQAGYAQKERAAELIQIEQSRRWWQRRGQRTSALIDLDWQIERMEKQAMVIQQRLSFLAGRQSPPRCLQCGSTDAFPFEVTPDFTVYYGKTQGPVALGVKHPGCGGELAVMDDGTRFSYIPTLRLYDSEGNRCVDV